MRFPRAISLFLPGLIVLVGAGCVGEKGFSAWPESSPLGAGLPAYAPGRSGRKGPRPDEPKTITGEVTLRQALAAALWYNPSLRSAAWEVRAREAEALQAALLPNPELEVSAESFGVNRDLRGARDMEVTAALSQLIWLGGDLAHRRNLARLRGREAGWDYEVQRVVVLTRTLQAFAQLVAVQDFITLLQRRRALLGKILQLFEERAASGHIAAKDLGLIRTQVRFQRVELALAGLRSRLVTARQRLAAQWGSVRPRFERAKGTLRGRLRVPPLERLLSAMEGSPAVRAWLARLESAMASVALAKAVGVPDLTLSGGVRVLPASGAVGFVVGLSIDLPFFDRNQGGIRAAKHRLRKARQRVRAIRADLAARLVAAHQQAVLSNRILTTLDRGLLPKAKLAVQAALDAYQGGKAGYLGVLDAEETLLSLETERLEANRRLLLAYSEMELILGRPLGRSRADLGAGAALQGGKGGDAGQVKQPERSHERTESRGGGFVRRAAGKEGRQ